MDNAPRRRRLGMRLAAVLCLPGASALAAAPAPLPNPAPGDEWVYRTTDLFTGFESGRYAMRFLRRDATTLSFRRIDLVSGHSRIVRLTHALGICSTSKDIPVEACGGNLAFPMAVGNRHGYERLPNSEGFNDSDCEVAALEKVAVPAGTFDAYRVECRGRWTYTGARDFIFRGRTTETVWYAPAVEMRVKTVYRLYRHNGGVDIQTGTELVSHRHGDDPATAAVDAPRAAPAEPVSAEFTSGGTRFAGRFTRDPGNTGYSGSGRVVWANGDTYDGTLVLGRREGSGTFVWADGQRFEGDWKADVPDGAGKLWFANGDRYEGSVAAGVPQGEGTMAYRSGDRYEGRFVAGVPHGAGRYAWASGDVYTGTFVAGLAEGEGGYAWKLGDRYEGGWKGGRKSGRGVFTWANGDRFEGLFVDDQRGEGTLTRKAP